MSAETVKQDEVSEVVGTGSALGDFVDAVQGIVNTATTELTVVEIVGVLELVKCELMAVSRERSLSEALDAAMGEAMLGGNA